MKKKTIIKKIALFSGLTLLALNIVGLIVPLRNSDIYTEENTYFKNDIIFSESELKSQLIRENETDQEFIEKSTNAIFNGIAHYWKDEGIDKYNLRIPIQENYLLFLASYIYPAKYEKYEYADYKKAIKRGVGLCSQHSIILSNVLENNGIDTKIINMPCHIVVMARADSEKEEWWITDADYGVIIKQSLEEAKKDLNIIELNYKAKGYANSVVNDILNCYKNILKIDDSALHYSGKKWYYVEKASYILKWIVPLFLIFMSIKLKTKTSL